MHVKNSAKLEDFVAIAEMLQEARVLLDQATERAATLGADWMDVLHKQERRLFITTVRLEDAAGSQDGDWYGEVFKCRYENKPEGARKRPAFPASGGC